MRAPDEYDYIIVGAGSAGCVLANRLTGDADVTVLLLEAGPGDASVLIHMPSAFAYPLAGTRYNWAYVTEPEPGMDGRRMSCPRGRVIGGSSSINGMVYIRGHALDYDGWAAAKGLERWTYADCLPYFRKAEAHLSGANAYHGGSGPLHVTPGGMTNPLYGAFIDAAVEAGYARTDDLNGYRQEGFGPMDRTTYMGRRWSAAMAYLRPARPRRNLTIVSRALAARVVFAPATVFAESVRPIIYRNIQENRDRVFSRSIRLSLLFGAIFTLPTMALGLFGEEMFALVFGVQMASAGKIAFVLSMLVAFNMATLPIVGAIPILGLQREHMAFELLGLTLRLGIVTMFKWSSPLELIFAASIGYIVVLLAFYIYAYLKAVGVQRVSMELSNV